MSIISYTKKGVWIFFLVNVSLVWIKSGFCEIELDKERAIRQKAEITELIRLEKKEKAVSLALNETEKTTAKKKKKPVPLKEVILEERESHEIKKPGKKESAERREVIAKPLRPGFERYYKEGTGFKITKFLGFAAYNEIYEEPNPVDDYLSEAKELNRRESDRMRNMLTPLFTRAHAVKAILDYKGWPRLTYTFDKRKVLHEFDTKYAIKDQRWQTQEISLLYTLPKIKNIGIITINPIYKRIQLSSEDDTNTAEDRDQYIAQITYTPWDNFEIFTKIDYHDGKKINTPWVSKQKKWLYQGELRLRFPKYKLSLTPGYSHSRTTYPPDTDVYVKQEISLDIGKELVKKLTLSLKPELIFSETVWPDSSPSNVEADVVKTEDKLSYNLFRDYYITGSVDWAHGIHFDYFDNIGIGLELEYFKPTFLRCKVGYKRYQYYALDDDIDTVYFKIYFFM